MNHQGQWTGTPIALGFMVDNRVKLLTGEKNPSWRKYVRFDRYVNVVVAYFELFKRHKGNCKKHGNILSSTAVHPRV
jgi:hypothetical protein